MTICLTPPPQFTAPQWLQVEQLLRTLDDKQMRSLNQYLSDQLQDSSVAAPTSSLKVMICHGGETGNCEALAKAFATLFFSRGIAAEVQDIAQLRVRQLARQEYVVLVCSTHGDGDPPEPVVPFYDALMANAAPALPNLKFAVLALGDSSYEQFCVTGQQFDQRLEALGATRLLNRVDCDVDFEQAADQWVQQLLDIIADKVQLTSPTSVQAPQTATKSGFSKQQPLTLEVLENIRLSASGRKSPVHHIELALEVSDFIVSPGDAVGVLPDNCPELVAAVLNLTQMASEHPVTIKGVAMPLVQALRESMDLTVPGPRFLEYWSLCSGHKVLKDLTASAPELQRAFLRENQICDLLAQYPACPEPQLFVDSLRPLQPRLYDIANSLNSRDDELHLLVKDYQYSFNDREKSGVASRYLVNLQPGESIRIYPHRNNRFHLPDEVDVPLILVADGTGIAPYRAFLQEIAARGSSHPVWLIFSEQRFEEDFLYQVDFQKAHEDGYLHFVDTVFYQDNPELTLADAILGREALLSEWLQKNAHIYLCGDKQTLQQCETTLESSFASVQEDGTEVGPENNAWKSLVESKRIHRNLY